MKRAMIGVAALLALTGCVVVGPGGGGGPGPGGAGPGPGPGPVVSYDAYYDGFYGAFDDGYWGPDGGFYYRRGVDHVYVRDYGNHFRRGPVGGYRGVRFHGGGSRPNGGPRPNGGGPNGGGPNGDRR